MAKTAVEALTDDIFQFVPISAMALPGLRGQIEAMVRNLLQAGFTIIPPGARRDDAPERETPGKGRSRGETVQGTSVRCPGCGAIDPDILFKSEFREVPQPDGGKPVLMGIAYIACAKETCHVIISAVAAPVQQRERVQ